MQARLHRSNFGIDGAGDFFERQFFVFGQDQDLALQYRQRADRTADDFGDIQCNTTGLNLHRLCHELFIPKFFPPVIVSPSFESEIPCDSKEERSNRSARRVETIRMAQQGHKHVLRNVLRPGCGTRHPPCESIDRILVIVKNDLEFRIRHSMIVARIGPKGYGFEEKTYCAAFMFNAAWTSESMASGLSAGAYRWIGSPLRSIRNFVKFHLIASVPRIPGFA